MSDLPDLLPPEPIRDDHRVDLFSCGVEELDLWLKSRAVSNQRNDASRTYVVCDAGKVVAGYYSLAAGAIERTVAPRAVARNMPNPIPVLVLGRLAIDRQRQQRGIGKSLLRDAMRRTVAVSNSIAIRGMLVHAINEDARQYYLRWGFLQSPTHELTLCLPIATIRDVVMHSQ